MKISAWMVIPEVLVMVAAVAAACMAQKPEGAKPGLAKEIITLPGARPGLPFSSGVKVGNVLYLSGVIGTDLKTNELVSPDVAGQTRKCMEKLQQILNLAGMDLENAVNVTVYLKDLEDYDEMNKAYAAYFPKNPPARACVQVADLLRDARVEISMIASE
jgi:2-iminobutanoate/2-iminopropanoate deaminase